MLLRSKTLLVSGNAAVPMNGWKWLCWVVLATLSICQAYALEPSAYAVDLTVEAQISPPSIILKWPQHGSARQYKISRKLPNEVNWDLLGTLPGNSTSFTDPDVSVGSAFEYEVEQATTYFPWPNGDPSQWINAYSYVYAGVNATLIEDRGKVVLIVDNSIAPSIASELSTFQRDLVGAGWQVIRRDVGRSASVHEVKNVIHGEYTADPSKTRSVFLIGHVPVPYSGAIAPDMHEAHRGAWPSDLFYGDMDGNWTDNSVSVTGASYRENHNVPGDGKFDQSEIPSAVELEVGRVDFADLPGFWPQSEIDLLRAYFRKNHEFRHRLFTLGRQGLIRDNFGDVSADAPAVDAWRHYGVFFGPNAVREARPGAFFSTLGSESFLWAYGGGGGDYKSIDMMGSSADFAQYEVRSAFLILHGSYFGDWNNSDNLLRAAIAGQNYTLASIWSGLPHWFMHHVGLGETLGFSTRVTQNNFTTYKTHRNFGRRQVHISLMGDPTLQIFPVAPPQNLTAEVGSRVTLNWQSSPDDSLIGYHVYYSQNAPGPFQRLTTNPIGATTLTHAAGPGVHHYMVRAIKLERTGSGSFYSASQGIFVQVDKGGVSQNPPTITAIENQTITSGSSTGDLPFSVEDSETPAGDLALQATSSNPALLPDAGLQFGGSGANRTIRITPTAGQTGTANVTIRVSDGELTASQSFLVTVIAGNSAPSADAQTVEVTEGRSTAIALSGRDPEGAPLQFILIENPKNGSLTGVPPNLTYIPHPGFAGVDSFTFRVSDGALESAPAIVTLNVTASNDPPTADSQVIFLSEDTSKSFLLTGRDPEGAALTFVLVAGASRGRITGDPPALSYTPDRDYFGRDELTFKVNDGSSDSAPATVTIQIAEVPDAPEIAPVSDVSARKNTAVLWVPFSFYDADTAMSNLLVSAASSSELLAATNGMFLPGSSDSNRVLAIFPSAGATGSALITLEATDGSLTGRTSFTLIITNTAPIATNDSVTVTNGQFQLEAAELLANDFDPDGDLLKIKTVERTSARGAALSLADGTITYSGPPSLSGIDAFLYIIEDTSGATAGGFVIIDLRVTPQFTKVSRDGAGDVTLTYTAAPNEVFYIEASTDARSWSIIGQTITDGSGSGEFRDTTARTNRFRLYRLETGRP